MDKDIEEIIKERVKMFKNTTENNIIESNSDKFIKDVIERSKTIPVVVDFYAIWCMPCNLLKPVLEKVVNENKGRVVLVKIDIDKNMELATKYNVMSVPTVKLFKNGKIVDEFVGAVPESYLKKWLERNL